MKGPNNLRWRIPLSHSAHEKFRRKVQNPFLLAAHEPCQTSCQTVRPHVARNRRHRLKYLDQRVIRMARNQPIAERVQEPVPVARRRMQVHGEDVKLVEEVGFHLAQECFWYNPAKMPVPAEWVTVRRVRVRDSVEYVWWLSKTPWPKASNLSVLKEYSEDMIRLNRNGVRGTIRPSGHVIRDSFDKIDAGGAIPTNVTEADLPDLPESMLKMGNNAANDSYTKQCKENGIKIHPARFPALLPKFFIKLLTDTNDLVVDPFAGSNTTGAVAESLRRRWIASEAVEEYLKASTFRFEDPAKQPDPRQVKLF